MAGNLRSPRKRALEIGTDASKFSDNSDYDTQAGCPTSHPAHGGTYADPCDSVKPNPGPKPPQGPQPL